jgi:hypothetical protein
MIAAGPTETGGSSVPGEMLSRMAQEARDQATRMYEDEQARQARREQGDATDALERRIAELERRIAELTGAGARRGSQVFLAKIDSETGSGEYVVTEVLPDGAGAWAARPTGRAGITAWESSLIAGLDVGTLVTVLAKPDLDTAETRYTFVAGDIDDHKVLASAGGDTPDVLDAVLTAGSGITLATALDGNSVEIGHDVPGEADTDQNTDYLSGLSLSGYQTCTGTEITITGAKDTLQFDSLGHRAGIAAKADDEVSFTVPDDLGDLADVSVSSPSNGDLLQYNSTSGKWEKVSTATQTVVTAVQVDGVLVQIKTRSIKVIAAGDESAWTTIHTGTNCA